VSALLDKPTNKFIPSTENMLDSEAMTLSEQHTVEPNRLRKVPRWRRAVRSVGWVLAGLVVVMLIWAAAQVLLRRPYPALLFTEADLPKLPRADENGWEVLRTEMRGIRDPQRPDKEIAEICDGKATFQDRWARAEARAQKLSDVAHDEKTKKWLAVADKAMAHPKFADACLISFEPDCPSALQLLALHQIQEAVVLHDAMGSRWEDAFVRVSKMMRVDIEYLASARSTLSQAIARAQPHRSMKLVEVLLDGAAQEKKQNRGPEAVRLAQFARDIDTLLKNIHEEDMAPRRAVVAEYLFSVYAIEHITDSSKGGFSKGSTIFYDPGHTLEMLNERFERYVVFASNGNAGEAPKFSRNRLWILRNPAGHLAIEALRGPLENHIPAIIKDRGMLMQDREALHQRLTALIK
jgi:hypothetical protein